MFYVRVTALVNHTILGTIGNSVPGETTVASTVLGVAINQFLFGQVELLSLFEEEVGFHSSGGSE